MKVLFFGDIVGKPGRQAIKKILPELKEKFEPDLILANGENLAHGKGISQESLKEAIDAGINWITTGNHVFTGKGAVEILEDKNWPVLRPANWTAKTPGRGFEIISLRSKKILLINLIGRIFMREQLNDPFSCVNEILEDYSLSKEVGKEMVSAIIVDWHAEATSEKVVMGWHLDGRVSAVLGTHTHVATDDARILPQGTAYISDVGMVGPRDSVLGVDKDIIIKRFLMQMPYKMELAPGPVLVNAVLITLDDKTGLAQNIEKIKEVVEVN
ncbi:MAG: TIGR00282 family metallophosphoesterase [Candidatus Portnoybacteria bacterium]|nr:TIGR00282 family metallophosphoesterase [Candidatus Portnoybacteria bacterium]